MRDRPTPTAQTGWGWGLLEHADAEGEPEKEKDVSARCGSGLRSCRDLGRSILSRAWRSAPRVVASDLHTPSPAFEDSSARAAEASVGLRLDDASAIGTRSGLCLHPLLIEIGALFGSELGHCHFRRLRGLDLTLGAATQPGPSGGKHSRSSTRSRADRLVIRGFCTFGCNRKGRHPAPTPERASSPATASRCASRH
jgi:hypothetical protein